MCDVLQSFGLTPGRVRAVATLDRRAAEEGFRAWATGRGWPVLAYTAEQLAEILEMPNPSAIVAQAVGTPGVCEPAAMLASGSRALLVPKQKHGRVTVAIARLTDDRSLPLPQPFPIEGEGGSGSARLQGPEGTRLRRTRGTIQARGERTPPTRMPHRRRYRARSRRSPDGSSCQRP